MHITCDIFLPRNAWCELNQAWWLDIQFTGNTGHSRVKRPNKVKLEQVQDVELLWNSCLKQSFKLGSHWLSKALDILQQSSHSIGWNLQAEGSTVGSVHITKEQLPFMSDLESRGGSGNLGLRRGVNKDCVVGCLCWQHLAVLREVGAMYSTPCCREGETPISASRKPPMPFRGQFYLSP